ncbi:XRE family transcriptional regulator [Luteolibacter sp. SL250]|uniref:XRE family transcriptional regulator n=1 Tax=Luteolibacter sp. SL250 TaxID=2995170 RepID=UPI0022710545|nr:XRE family transcriptional regulator [Luteolibacter sp. SL250]WAC20913.1 XRE family transcriptional regulator [Luteolibacter sp. SL250]
MTQDNATSNSPKRFNPKMLTLARDYAEMTQAELAEELKVSQGSVSKLEEDLIPASDETLEKLSRIFKRPVTFFCQFPGFPLTLEGHFRKKASLTKKLLKKADSRMNIERLQINQLVESSSLDFSDPPFCNPDEYIGGPKQIAQEIRRFLQLPPGPIEDLVEVVERCGCIVRFLDFGTLQIDGFAILSGANVPIIFINKAFPSDRRRLTLGHEFGHVIMHRGCVRPNMDEEAFTFAGEFLMPEKEIKPSLYPLNLEKLARLKLKWKVSMAAILQHAKRISAVNERYYRYMRAELSKSGYSKQEPYEESIPTEKPKLLTKVFRHFKDDLGYSIEEMSTLIFASQEEVKSLARPNHDRFTILD